MNAITLATLIDSPCVKQEEEH